MAGNDGLENVEDAFPLSEVQAGMLYHCLAEPEGDLYLSQFVLELSGTVEPASLRYAWQTIVDRHEALRVLVAWDGLEVPLHVVQRELDAPWKECDLCDGASGDTEEEAPTALDDFLKNDRIQGVALDDVPLHRLALVQVGAARWRLVWTFHHIILDGWSARRVMDELLDAYAARIRGELRRPADVLDLKEALERRAARQGGAETGRAVEWENRFRSVESICAIAEAGYEARTGGGSPFRVERRLSAVDWQSIETWGQRHSLTASALIHGVWAALLRHYTRESTVVFGSTLSGRDAEAMGSIGCLLNTLPLVLGDESASSVVEFLRGVQQQHVGLRDQEGLALTAIQRWSGREGGQGLFDSVVVYEGLPEGGDDALSDLGIQIGGRSIFEFSHYGTALLVEPHPDGLTLYLISNGKRYSESFAERLLLDLEAVLRGLPQSGELAVFEMLQHCLSDSSRNALVGESLSAPVPESVLSVLQRNSIERRDHVALVGDTESVTYAELWSMSGGLAKRLRAAGLGEGQRVGLYGPRSPRMILAMIAVLRSGAAYVPLDAEYPESRFQRVVADANLGLILALGSVPLKRTQPIPVWDLETCCDSENDAENGEPDFPQASEPAYLIYTSGSTGKPKGVVVTHGNLAWSTAARLQYYREQVPEVFLLLSSLAFDSSVAGIYWTLASGGTLVLPPRGEEREPERLAERIEASKGTHTLCLPSLWAVLLDLAPDSALARLRSVIVAGEAVNPELVTEHRARLPQVRLENEYGPTEGTVWATAQRFQAEADDCSVSIGRPVPGAAVALMDRDGVSVPPGVIGEVYLAGPGIAEGYWQQPDETAQCFVDGTRPGTTLKRWYRTGDLASCDAEGRLYFAGRGDAQLKVRGYRIEVGEIEMAVHASPDIAEVAVVGVVNRPGSTSLQRLMAFVRLSDGCQDDSGWESGLRDRLVAELPSYMMPHQYVALPDFPRLPNGKVDRAKLASMEVGAADSKPADDVLNETESALADIWKEVLQVDHIRPEESFYELGGDSLLSIRVASLARDAGLDLSPADFADDASLRSVAARCSSDASVSEVEAGSDGGSGEFPLTPIQVWFFDCEFAVPEHWNQTLCVEIPREISGAALDQAIRDLFVGHAVLRTRFAREERGWRSEVVSADKIRVEQVSLEGDDAAREAGLLEKVRDAQVGFRDGAGPWSRVLVFADSATGWRSVCFVVHHLLVDLLSWRVLIDDFDRLLSGQRLPVPKASYALWAEKLSAAAKAGQFHSERAVWLDAMKGQPAPLPRDHAGSERLVEGGREVSSVRLSAEQAREWVDEPCERLRLRPQEWILAAVARVLMNRHGRESVRIDVEQHGRSAFLGNLDIGRTVGWFTSYFPLVIPMGSRSEIGPLVKEALRSKPNGGLGFGVLKYLSEDEETAVAFAELGRGDVLFNYSGDLSDAESLSQGASNLRTRFLDVNSRALENRQMHLFEIDVAHKSGGEITVQWSFNHVAHERGTVDGILIALRDELEAMSESDSEGGQAQLSPVDFEDADIDQADLDALLGDS